jgi:poly(A) polymerase
VIRKLTHQDLSSIPADLMAGALRITRRLEASGHRALFAGGVVRDLLLKRPISDLDIATSAPPDTVEALFSRTIPVGKQFGVMIVLAEGRQYEVATFRSEGAYLDGRHPTTVHFTSAEEDARRRDFTVNALFLDPESLEVIDYAGGLADLERRVLKTVGDPSERFEEDRLRILRAVRFVSQLGFEIDRRTFEQVKKRAASLVRVSPERVRDEILRILTGPDPVRGLDLLLESGILAVILPEVAALEGVPQPPEYHPEGDVLVHTRLMFKIAGRIEDPILALGVLLHDIGKPPTFTVKERIRFDGHDKKGAEMAKEVCRRLRLSSDETEEVVELVREHLRFIPVKEMRESTLKRFLRNENIEKHLELHRLDCLASHEDLTSYEFCVRKLAEFGREAMKPPPLLNGDDLIALGFKPAPLFSEILERLEDLQLEGRLQSREEALEWVKANYQEAPG